MITVLHWGDYVICARPLFWKLQNAPKVCKQNEVYLSFSSQHSLEFRCIRKRGLILFKIFLSLNSLQSFYPIKMTVYWICALNNSLVLSPIRANKALFNTSVNSIYWSQTILILIICREKECFYYLKYLDGSPCYLIIKGPLLDGQNCCLISHSAISSSHPHRFILHSDTFSLPFSPSQVWFRLLKLLPVFELKPIFVLVVVIRCGLFWTYLS